MLSRNLNVSYLPGGGAGGERENWRKLPVGTEELEDRRKEMKRGTGKNASPASSSVLYNISVSL